MPSPFNPGTTDFRQGDRVGRLLSADYQNALKKMANQQGQEYAGYEGNIPQDVVLTQLPIQIRIMDRTRLSDGTFQFDWNLVNVNDPTNTTFPIQNDASKYDSTVLGIYAFNLSNDPHVPIDGSCVVRAYYNDAGTQLIFNWQAAYFTLARATAAAAVNAALPWEEVSQVSNGTLDLFPGGLTGNTTVNQAFEANGQAVANQTVGILARGYSAGGVRVTVVETVAGIYATLVHCEQTIVIENATGGDFGLIIEGTPTGPIPFDGNATDVKTAIDAALIIARPTTLPTVTVTGAGTTGSPFLVIFSDYDQYEPMAADIRELKTTQKWIFIAPGTGNGTVSTVDYLRASITDNTFFPYYSGSVQFQPSGAAITIVPNSLWDIRNGRRLANGTLVLAHRAELLSFSTSVTRTSGNASTNETYQFLFSNASGNFTLTFHDNGSLGNETTDPIDVGASASTFNTTVLAGVPFLTYGNASLAQTASINSYNFTLNKPNANVTTWTINTANLSGRQLWMFEGLPTQSNVTVVTNVTCVGGSVTGTTTVIPVDN